MAKKSYTKQGTVNRQNAILKGLSTFEGSKCCVCGGTVRHTKNNACINCFTETRMSKNFETRKTNLVSNLKQQAKLKDRKFDITVSDIDWVTHCPVLGIELNYFASNARDKDTATFDRKDSSKGYVKGNVFIISNKANSCKSDLTIEQMENMIRYAKN